MFPNLRKPLLALVILTVIVGFAVLALRPNRTPERVPLPNPNGYDDFIKAADLITGDVGNSSALNQDDLRKLISANSEALRVLRVGLGHRCSVPTEFFSTNQASWFSDLPKLKGLVRLLAGEGRLAEMENRSGEAARSYIDGIRYGNEISRGGCLINRLVGIACEMMSLRPLSKLVPKLDCEQARPLILELEKVDEARVTWDEILQNEKAFANHQSHNPIYRLSSWWVTRSSLKQSAEKHERLVAQVRLLAIELALRCYQSEHGCGPDRLEQLVPKQLKRVALDPFSNKPMVYRAQGTNWLLYSVGPDGVDDGGMRVGPSVPGTPAKGDVFFDSP